MPRNVIGLLSFFPFLGRDAIKKWRGRKVHKYNSPQSQHPTTVALEPHERLKLACSDECREATTASSSHIVTRVARRTSLAMAFSLPYELVDLIVSSVSGHDEAGEESKEKKRDHRSLCLVSSIFYRSAHPRLYRTISLDGTCELELLRRTLVEQPGLGAAIRHLWVSSNREAVSGGHQQNLQRGESLVKDAIWPSLTRLQEAAWITTDEQAGGFRIGHAVSVHGKESETDEALLHYHLVLPSLEPWVHTLLRSIARGEQGTLASVTITVRAHLNLHV